MKWSNLTPRDRRAVQVGALLLVPALLFSVLIRPYLTALRATEAHTIRERDLLHRERALLAGVRSAPAHLQRAERVLLAEAPHLFGGSDLGTASAALAHYVGNTAAAHRVFLQGSETRPPEGGGDGVARIRVDLRAVSDLEGLLAFLHELETGPKLLTVEALAIAQTDRINGVERADEEILGLAATITGYVLEADR
jgi:hypothetical protein